MKSKKDKALTHTTKPRDNIDHHHNQDAFDRAREIAEKQDAGVVFLPRRQIKVGKREDLRHDGPPWSSESKRAWTEDDFQLGIKKKLEMAGNLCVCERETIQSCSKHHNLWKASSYSTSIFKRKSYHDRTSPRGAPPFPCDELVC